MSGRTGTVSGSDVVELLLRQHERIRRSFADVTSAEPADRGAAFDRLRRLLAVHETAEEVVVHPAARSLLANGEQVVATLLDEEDAIRRGLADLEHVDPAEPAFLDGLATVRSAVTSHAEREEREEFPYITSEHSAARRNAMGAAVEATEAVAAAHTDGSSTPLAGSYEAITDEARAVLREALRRPADSD